MWNRLKGVQRAFKSTMATTGEELALEALEDRASPDVDQKMSEDESSIEALTWSDFDEEEMEVARRLAEQEFPNSTNVVMQESSEEMKKSVETEKESDESTQTSIVSVVASHVLPDVEFPEEIQDTEPTTAVDQVDEADDFVKMSLTSGCAEPATVVTEDSASNAPVLDEGPIWGKGEKSYRFHENRKINQKLTFGVLISVVLAIGIGVGNLVAYNEYESESGKVDHLHCPSPANSPQPGGKPNDLPLTTGFPSSTHIKDKGPSPIHGASLHPDANSKETLAYVVKSIDELSRKIDQFQNTTKQLSGILVLKDDTLLSYERNRKSQENLKSKERYIEDDLLPTFNDDVSSWETSGERLVKFSDVVYEPALHEVPISDDDIAEGQPDAVSPKKITEDLPSSSAGAVKHQPDAVISESGNAPVQIPLQRPESTQTSAFQTSKKEKSPGEDKYIPKRGKSIDRENPKDERSKRGKSVDKEAPAGKKSKRENSVDRVDVDRRNKRENSIDREDSPRRNLKLEKTVDRENFENKKKRLRREKAVDEDYIDVPTKRYKREKSLGRENVHRPNKKLDDEKAFRKDRIPDQKREKIPKYDQVSPQENERWRREKSVHQDEISMQNEPQRGHRVDYDAARNKIYYNRNFHHEKKYPNEQKPILKQDKRSEKEKKENILSQEPEEQWMKPKKYKKERPVTRDYVKFDVKFSNSGNNLEDFKTNSKQYRNGKPNRDSFYPGSNRNEEIKNQQPLKPRNFEGPNMNHFNKDIEDWDSSRAKAREDQRVHHNWDNDFSSDKIKRKRNQNWQIERDRLREKVRKDPKNYL